MRTRSIALWLGVLAAAPQLAAAQPTTAQAETLFRRGRQLVAQGKLAEACTAFEGSQAIEPMVTTQINLADCREKNRQLATAWGLYLDVQRQLRKHPDNANPRLAKVAAQRAARLEPKLSHLTIAAGAVAGLEITRSGDKVDRGSWNQALPIDGGTYDIIARVPGRADWSTRITIAPAGDARTVTVPTLAAPDPAADPARSSTAASDPARRHAGASSGRGSPTRRAEPARPSRVPALVTLGAGTAAVAGSLVIGVLAQHTWRDAKAICGGDLQCDDPAQAARASSLAHDARSRAWWATGVGATGAVALGVGTWLMLRSPSGEREHRVQLAPHAERDTIGLVAWGRF